MTCSSVTTLPAATHHSYSNPLPMLRTLMLWDAIPAIQGFLLSESGLAVHFPLSQPHGTSFPVFFTRLLSRPGWVSTTEEPLPIKFSCPLSITTLCWCCHLLHCPNYAEIGQLLLLMQHVLSALNHGCLDGSKHCSGLTSSHSALILSLGSICCVLDSFPNKIFLKPTPYLQFVW